MDKLEILGRLENIQTTVLLRSVRILRTVLESSEDMLSPGFQWKSSVEVKNSQGGQQEKHLDIARELKKTCGKWKWQEYQSRKAWNKPQEPGKETSRAVNLRNYWNHPDYITIEIGWNSAKIPGKLRRLAFTWTPVEAINWPRRKNKQRVKYLK